MGVPGPLAAGCSITHLQSSTQVLELGGVRILTDPWLTEGEYYGSWFHYPPFDPAWIARLDYDLIYVSHIHPDHLSERTFRALPRKVPVLIHRYEAKFLRHKIEALGFEAVELAHGEPYPLEGGGSVTIYAADDCNPELCGRFLGCAPLETRFGSTQLDSLALFEAGGQRILNTNDCPFELARVTLARHGILDREIDVLLVGYAGAGPYPQCFEFPTEAARREAAQVKQRRALDQAARYLEQVRPKAYIPFAGTYILGSRRARLSPYRGVPTVPEALADLRARPGITARGIGLEPLDRYDLASGEIRRRAEPPALGLEAYTREIAARALDYDQDEWDDADLPGLAAAAWERFRAKAAEIGFCSATELRLRAEGVCLSMSLERPPASLPPGAPPPAPPYLQLTLDRNLLHRLLRGPRFAHWNNAEIGSHLGYVRDPDVFERGLYYCLCFLHR